MVLVVAGLISGDFYYYLEKQIPGMPKITKKPAKEEITKLKEEAAPPLVPTPTPTPTPRPTPKQTTGEIDFDSMINIRPNQGNSSREVLVEGEIGYLRGSSEVQTKVEITPDDFTKPEDAKEFVEKTGVNQLAVVFGNIHGIVTEQEEKLDIEHFKKIVMAVPDVFYVLHGASGLKDEDVRAAIKAGVTNVHFNTELRVAYTEGIHRTLHDKPNETTPYKYLAPAVEEVKKVVAQKIKIFMGK